MTANEIMRTLERRVHIATVIVAALLVGPFLCLAAWVLLT